MSKAREQLIDRMIRLYGFEHKIVIDFVSMCERYEDTKDNDVLLGILVEAHENDPVIEAEDDE